MRVRLLALLALLLAAPASAAPAPGDRLAPFTLPLSTGGSGGYRTGRPAVLSFCAFWCDTWKEQNRRLADTRRALQGLPVDYLMVSVDGRWAEKGKGSVDGPVLLDTGGSLTRSLQINAVPYTVLVDGEGRVLHGAQGITRGTVLQDLLRGIVSGEPAPEAGPVYLTFDDFPSGPGDDELLDVLRAAGVQATFFCIGRNVERWPEIVRRAAREGHSLQMHSWDHDARAPQLGRCRAALRRVAGTEAQLYRPPGSSAVLRGSEKLPLGTVNTFDYTRPGEPELLRRILSAARPGCEIQLHCGVEQTRAVLPRVIEALVHRGLALRRLE